MRRRLYEQGLEYITPRIMVVTRLIPQAMGTTCNERIERIHGTEHAYILRVPWRDESGRVRLRLHCGACRDMYAVCTIRVAEMSALRARNKGWHQLASCACPGELSALGWMVKVLERLVRHCVVVRLRGLSSCIGCVHGVARMSGSCYSSR